MPRDSSTDDILQRAIEGDERALQALLVREGATLRAQIVHELRRCHLHPDNAVDELLQTVWMRVARGIRKFRLSEPGAFRAWLKKIAVNATRSHARQVVGRREVHPGSVHGASGTAWSAALLDHLQHDSETPSRVCARQELEERLNRALAELPPKYRQAVELHFRDGLPVAEAALRMACSVGQVRGLLQRGLEKLRASPWLHEGGSA